jgi:hypothetical protein
MHITRLFTALFSVNEPKALNLFSAAVVCSAAFIASTSDALATTMWTDWTEIAFGDPGSASGTLGSTTISYSGEVIGNSNINGTSTIWNPESTYVGGLVDTSPDSVGDHIALNGSTNTSTISFSTPVLDPVIAIWSLGQPGATASFTYDATPILQVGGPNSIYGGSSIIIDGNTVSGNEGNGVILFDGVISSISFTNTSER